MNTIKNRYQLAKKKRSFLNGPEQAITKHSVPGSVLNTAYDLAGIAVGGILGSLLPKGSLYAGLLATTGGYYLNNKLLQRVGIGLIAAPIVKLGSSTGTLTGMDPFSGMPPEPMDGIKDRLLALKDMWYEKVLLHAPKPATTTTATATTPAATTSTTAAVHGVEDTQYFQYPENLSDTEHTYTALTGADENLDALDQIEEQLSASAVEFASSQQGAQLMGEFELSALSESNEVSGEEPIVNGTDNYELNDIESMIL